MRFEKKDDHYLDTKTGLKWSLDNYGLKMDWFEAMGFCRNLGDGWRLPTIEEITLIINYTKFNPATDLPGMVSASYWSATTYADYTDGAWHVDFYNGNDDWHSKSYNYYVRAVRGGK